MTKTNVARLKDVAKAAGVSVAAVSRYLGGSLTLAPDTAVRIDNAVRSLDYRPNPHAVRLSKGRSETIGLVVPDIASLFFARIATEIESAVDAVGYGLVLCVTLNRPGRELEYLDRLRRNHVDGLIFMTNHLGSRGLGRAINEASPIVLVDEDVQGAKAPRIFCDNEPGGYLATRHLIEAGHRRLAFVGGPEQMLTTRERLAGYRRAIAEAGPAAQSVDELFGDYNQAQGRAATEAFVAHRNPATGIFFSSDEALKGGLEVLIRHGIAIPRDVSIVTFGDIEPLHLFSPPVTAIRQPLAEMGRRGVETLLSLSKTPAGFVDRLPVSLVVRSSVASPPARGPRSGNGTVRRRAAISLST